MARPPADDALADGDGKKREKDQTADASHRKRSTKERRARKVFLEH